MYKIIIVYSIEMDFGGRRVVDGGGGARPQCGSSDRDAINHLRGKFRKSLFVKYNIQWVGILPSEWWSMVYTYTMYYVYNIIGRPPKSVFVHRRKTRSSCGVETTTIVVQVLYNIAIILRYYVLLCKETDIIVKRSETLDKRVGQKLVNLERPPERGHDRIDKLI